MCVSSFYHLLSFDLCHAGQTRPRLTKVSSLCGQHYWPHAEVLHNMLLNDEF